MSKPDNPLAFPVLDCNGTYMQPGMDLRDYFAGKAMNGIVSDPTSLLGMGKLADENDMSVQKVMAKWAYEQADAMLAERVKEETS